jgi:hypothetical protein
LGCSILVRVEHSCSPERPPFSKRGDWAASPCAPRNGPRRLVLRPFRLKDSRLFLKAAYIVQVFVVASQCILAFRQECLVVGILVAAAIVGAVKPTASPNATIAAMTLFIDLSSFDTIGSFRVR